MIKKENETNTTRTEDLNKEFNDKLVNRVIKTLIGYALFSLFVVLLFKFVLMISLIPSGSMESTIYPGDLVISNRIGISEESINRYDILIFNPPDDPSITYIKRVIGLPGETVVVENGKVYVDGVEIDNSFIKGPQNRKGDGTYVVPEGCYFFLGDNRNNSRDSRFWKIKYVPLENIQAKAWFIVFPLSHVDGL